MNLIVDNFAGGGGASSGIARALGRPVDVAINHDAEAVAMHRANHPETRHFCQSIMAIDPQDACTVAGPDGLKVRPVALAWFSPDCKHHSKAKGGKPREKNIRDLAWVVVHWPERLGENAPEVICLENVEEFRKWGPLDEHGQPIRERQGEEFDLWVRRLRRCGYKVEWRELRACDYGAPTSRKRLYLVARRDRLPIRWPEPTHFSPAHLAAHPELVEGLPWRTAAECIDWSRPCPSIFERRRALKEATLRRIAHGTMRYVVNAARPFIVPVTNTGWNPDRLVDADLPLPTITTAKGGEMAVVVPHITKFRGGAIGSDAGDPMPTVTDGPVLSKVEGGNPASPAGAQPLALASATIVATDFTNTRASRSFPIGDPLRTVTAQNAQAIAGATLIQMGYGEREGQAPRALDPEAPLGTMVAGGNKHAAVTTFLSQFRGSNRTASGGDPAEPAKAVTAHGLHQAVVAAHIEQANTGMVGHDARRPLSTIVGKGCTQRIVETTLLEEGALPPELMDKAVRVAAFLIKYYGNEDSGHVVDAPIGTVTTRERFAVVTVTIDAVAYVIVDIGMRMLTPRELARAQGFPDSYVLDPIGPSGKPLSKSAQIRMIGNSVCPDVAAALVAANIPARLAAAQPAEAVA